MASKNAVAVPYSIYSYPWMRTVFGNPNRHLKFLDRRREEMLRDLPENVAINDIAPHIRTEWDVLTFERDKALQEIVRQKVHVMFNRQVLEVYTAIKGYLEIRALNVVDTGFPELNQAFREISEYIKMNNIENISCEKQKSVESGGQTDFDGIPTLQEAIAAPPILMDSELSDGVFLDDDCVGHDNEFALDRLIDADLGRCSSIGNIDFASDRNGNFNPGATSTPLKNSAYQGLSHKIMTERPDVGVNPKEELRETYSGSPPEPQVVAASENIEEKVLNGSHVLNRSSSCPVALSDQPTFNSTNTFACDQYSCSRPGSVSSRSNGFSLRGVNSLKTLRERANMNPWSLPALPVVTETLPNMNDTAKPASHNESID